MLTQPTPSKAKENNIDSVAGATGGEFARDYLLQVMVNHVSPSTFLFRLSTAGAFALRRWFMSLE